MSNQDEPKPAVKSTKVYPKADEQLIKELQKVVSSKKVIRRMAVEPAPISDVFTDKPIADAPKLPNPPVKHSIPGESNINCPVKQFPSVIQETAKGANYLSIEDPTSAPIPFDNPVAMLLVIDPEVKLHKWQFETLMMLAGYLTPGDYKTKTEINDKNPLRLAMAAANGSGKDRFIIAGANVWFAVSAVQNYGVITSSSFDQVKFQTEPHIKKLCDAINAKFGRTFYSTQFHHQVKRFGSQIRLFATNEAGRAEGSHPYGRGKMMLTMNEAKSLDPAIFDAMERCSGYSYWLEVSSPAGCSGHFYDSAKNATRYPAPLTLNKTYFRQVSQYECPHISQAHIDNLKEKYGEDSALFKSSVLAEFSDAESDNIIKASSVEICANATVPEIGNDIGIGLDLAAGGDENGCFVRKGNRVIHKFFFTQTDTTITADLIDTQLSTWKAGDYLFNADDGGVGHAIVDMLKRKGWNIRRRNNQSAAHSKREFSNLGAEMWYWMKRLIERKLIIIPSNIPKLIYQLTNRYHLGLDQTQGRIALEPKSIARAKGHASPDRADAFVLCFMDYRPDKAVYEPKAQPDAGKFYTADELSYLLRRQGLNPEPARQSGAYTLLNGSKL
jgi:hypothetical protein